MRDFKTYRGNLIRFLRPILIAGFFGNGARHGFIALIKNTTLINDRCIFY
ncbi:MAG: hypothetical protein ACOX4P_08790 [Anaerovoracaceae bacterium]